MSSDTFLPGWRSAEDHRHNIGSRARELFLHNVTAGASRNPPRSLRADRTGKSAYSGCHSVASDGIVNRDAGKRAVEDGNRLPVVSLVGGICGSPIGARRHVVEGIDARGDGD
jgi:hypothetical protein